MATQRNPRQAVRPRNTDDEQECNGLVDDQQQATTDPTVSLSRTKQLIDLSVGSSISEAERLSFDHTRKETIEDALTRLRGTMAKAVSRATQSSGQKYSIESGTIFTRSMDLLVVVVVTRTE